MKAALIVLGILAGITLLVLLTAYICFRITFYASRKGEDHEAIQIPEGSIYLPHKDEMVSWIKRIRALPQEEFSIQSFDGLTLRGRYFEYAPGAPIELLFNGYRGTAERDMCGGVFRCFSIGRSAFLVDQRACGYSDGHVISFGVNESRDCLAWVNFLVKHFGPDVKILLSGISMGASTVLTAAGMPLPENVIGVLADCGFTSAKDIICKVMKEDMGLPPVVLYPFVRLGARLFGRFDPEERSAIAAMIVHLCYNLFGIFVQAGLSGYCKSTGSIGLLVVLLIALPLFYLMYSAENPHEEYLLTEEYIKSGYSRSAIYSYFKKTTEAVITAKYIELTGAHTINRIYVPAEDMVFVKNFILKRLPENVKIRYN